MDEWEPAMDQAREELDLPSQGQLLSLMRAPEHEAIIGQTIHIDIEHHARMIMEQHVEIAHSLGHRINPPSPGHAFRPGM
jgi:hypothetical protein